MRIRSIKPEFFKDEDVADLSPWARLVFIGLWCMADRDGRLEDRPRRIKVEVLPYDDCDVDAMLTELHQAGFIVRYSVDDKVCIQVVNFAKHQRITGREAETPSELPGVPQDYNREAQRQQPGSQTEATRKQSGNNRDTPEEQSGNSRCPGREGKGKDTIVSYDTPGSMISFDEAQGNKDTKEPEACEANKDPVDWTKVVADYNAIATKYGLPLISRLTENRKRKYRLRLAEGFSLANIDGHIAASEFLRSGKWFGFDWLTANAENWLKVCEGKYDDVASRPVVLTPEEEESIRAARERMDNGVL